MSKIIYVDTETSGLHPSTAVVLEVAGVYVVDGREVDYFQALCNPGEEVLANPAIDVALEINKITREELREAMPTEHVAESFKRFLVRCGLRSGALLSAFNNQFDKKFLAVLPWTLDDSLWGPCIMLMAAEAMDPYRKKWPRLKAAAEHFSLEWDGTAHRALADARMAARVHQAIESAVL